MLSRHARKPSARYRETLGMVTDIPSRGGFPLGYWIEVIYQYATPVRTPGVHNFLSPARKIKPTGPCLKIKNDLIFRGLKPI